MQISNAQINRGNNFTCQKFLLTSLYLQLTRAPLRLYVKAITTYRWDKQSVTRQMNNEIYLHIYSWMFRFCKRTCPCALRCITAFLRRVSADIFLAEKYSTSWRIENKIVKNQWEPWTKDRYNGSQAELKEAGS